MIRGHAHRNGPGLLALHGTYGEDALCTGIWKAGSAYTGCDSEASRTAFDKVMTKRRVHSRRAHRAVFGSLQFTESDVASKWQPPVVLKPCGRFGVGLRFVERVRLERGACRGVAFTILVLLEEKF